MVLEAVSYQPKSLEQTRVIIIMLIKFRAFCTKDKIIETPVVSYCHRTDISYPDKKGYSSLSLQFGHANSASQK